MTDAFYSDAHSFERNLFLLAVIDNFRDAFVRESRTGDQDFLNPMLSTDVAQHAVAAKDAQAMNNFAFLVRVVIDKTDGRVLQLTVIQYFTKQ